MITDLLDYTKTRLGRGIEIRPIEGDLDVLCQQVFEEIRAAHPGRTMTYGSSGDLGAAFDPARMRQVISNLLGNAIQHGDPGHPVSLETTQNTDHVCAIVANRGEAIPRDALHVIFDPMVRIAKTPTKADERPTTSLGLGLYIAREIVNATVGRSMSLPPWSSALRSP